MTSATITRRVATRFRPSQRLIRSMTALSPAKGPGLGPPLPGSLHCPWPSANNTYARWVRKRDTSSDRARPAVRRPAISRQLPRSITDSARQQLPALVQP